MVGLGDGRHGGQRYDEDEVDDGRQETADGAPLDRHGQHAVHAKHDEKVVPHHRVAVQWKTAPGISEPEESTT